MTGPAHRTDVAPGLGFGAILLALLAAALAMVGVSAAAFLTTERELAEARLAKAATVAGAVRADLDRALAYRVPLDKLEGVGDFLEGIVARNPDLRFFAVTGPSGERLHYAGIGRRRLDPVLDLIDRAPAATPGVVGRPVQAEEFLVLRYPLRDGAGTLMVAVQPKQIREQLFEELPRALAFALAVLILVFELAGSTVQEAFRAPLGRLARAMTDVADGRFGTLLGRRPRDGLGRAMFAFNATVFRVHELRQRFVAHADEVRAAVFDADVAAEVERTRDRTLAALGEGLAEPPVRRAVTRRTGVRPFATLVAAAGVLAATAALHGAAMAETAVAVGLAALGVGLLAGFAPRPTRAAAVASALAVAGLAASAAAGGQGAWLLPAVAAATGLGAGSALKARRVSGAGRSGRLLLSLLLGALAGGLAAYPLFGDTAAQGVTAAALALAAAVWAVRLTMREGSA